MTPILIAAASGRALAASARRGGYAPLVADFFGDSDTLASARRHVRLDDGLARGMEEDALIDALDTLASDTLAPGMWAPDAAPAGLVWGTGFEDRPALLERVARRWRLLGNTPETVAAIKDPAGFARLCAGLGIPHPETSRSRPQRTDGWLAKRAGGAGGLHIRPAAERDDTRADVYFQREVAGSPVSIAFLADGRHAMVLGSSAQWVAPMPGRPYRYGGAVRPAILPAGLEDALIGAVRAIVAAIPLVGLNSADFLVEGDAFHLLEINPRPGATLDIFEPRDGSLFALHVAACEGRLPGIAPDADGAMASAIVYADRDIGVVPPVWPDWTADRPHAGTRVGTGEPYCTVIARAPTAAGARRLVEDRARAILRHAEAEAA